LFDIHDLRRQPAARATHTASPVCKSSSGATLSPGGARRAATSSAAFSGAQEARTARPRAVRPPGAGGRVDVSTGTAARSSARFPACGFGGFRASGRWGSCLERGGRLESRLTRTLESVRYGEHAALLPSYNVNL
jgi:hypothetical protein